MAKDLYLFPDRDVKQVSLGDEGGSTGAQPKKKSAKEIMAAANEQRRIDSGQKSAKEIMAAANQQRLVDDAGRVDGAYISSFFQDAQSFLNQSQADLEGMSWASSRDQHAQANRNAQFSDLDYRAKVIGSFLESNKAGMDEKSYNELLAGLDSYNSLSTEARGYFDALGQYYAMWDTQEAYDTDQRKGGYFQTYGNRTEEELAHDLEMLKKGNNAQVGDLQKQKNLLQAQGRDSLAAGAPKEEIKSLLDQIMQVDQQIQQAQALAKDEEAVWLENYLAEVRQKEDYMAWDIDAEEANLDALKQEKKHLEQAIRDYESSEHGDLSTNRRAITQQNKYKRNKERLAEVSELIKEKETGLSRARVVQENHAYTSRYMEYMGMMADPEFEEKSKYIPQEKKPMRAIDIMGDNYSENASPWEDTTYEAINGNEEAIAYLSEAGASYYGSEAGAIGRVWGRATKDESQIQQMTPDEVAVFNYLYATQGKAAAYEFYNFMLSELNDRERKAVQEYWANYAHENQALASVYKVITSPFEGLSYIEQTADYLADGELEKNASYNNYIWINSAIQQQVSADIEKKWGKAGSSGYNAGMSMLDFLWSTAVAGGNQTLALGIMGTGSAADTTVQALDRGLSSDQAFALGTVAGLSEILMENISFNALFKGDMSKGTVAYILNNAFQEGGEEVGTSVINLLADIIISKDKSQWRQSIDAYIAQGYSEEEAFGLAVGDQAASMGLDFLGGFLSGGVMSGGNYAVSTMQQNADYKQVYGADAQALVTQALTLNPYNSFALEMAAKLEAGKTLSGAELRQLVQLNENAAGNGGDQAEDDTPEGDNTVASKLAAASQRGQIDATVQPLEQQILAEAAPMSAREAFQAEINRQMVGGNVSNLDTEALADGVRARAVEALDSGEIDREAYRMAMDELEQMDLEAEGRAHARANQEAQVETVWRKLGRKLGLVNENGGNANGTANYEWQSEAARSYLYDGGGQRDAGTGTGGQAASLAEGPGIPQPGADTGAEKAGGADSSQSIRVSGQALGISRSTEEASIRMILPQAWTDEQVALAQEIQEKTGKQAVFILDTIPVRNADGSMRRARGAFTGEQVIVQVNNPDADAEQIADHETYHAQNAYFDGKLNEEVKANIIKRFSKEEFEAVVAEYVKALEGVYDVGTGVSETMNQAALELIEEEVLADAYAGINAFGANAGRFSWAAWEKTSELGLGYPGKEMRRELGSGPPVESYSIVFDENENTNSPADTKFVINAIRSNLDAIPESYVFDVSYDPDVESFEKKSEYVLDIFDKQGGMAYNQIIGNVELRKSGAKSTIHHGFGRTKLAATKAIKPVIENGSIIYTQKNYQGSGVDRYVVAARGIIDGENSIVGVIIKAYPNPKLNAKFYLHEAVIIKEDLPTMTAPQLSVDAVGKSSFKNSVPQDYDVVKETFSVDESSYRLNAEEDEARVAYFENVGAQRKRRYEDRVRKEVEALRQRSEAEPSTENAFYEQSAEEDAERLQYFEDMGAQRKQRYEDRVRKEVEAVRRRSEPEPSTENAVYEQSAEEDAERLQYFEDMGAQRKQQYVEGIREAESDARLEYFEQRSELQPGEDVDPEQVAREVEEMRRRSEPKPEPAEAEPVTPIAREDLPAKARDNLTRKENAAIKALRRSFGVTQTNAREFLKETVQQISDEYLTTGKISQETVDRLFEDAWKKGEIEDREFYDQYEHIKEKLRTTAVTLDARDKGDIADFNKFKQKCYQTLRIVNEGGMPVDSLYEELRGMAPELFPESITHPADQLVKMYEVGKSIVKRKASLDVYYGPEAADMKRYARKSFDDAMDDFRGELWKVRRFVDDKATRAEKKAQQPKVRTVEEALEAGNKMKDARRAAERAVAKNLLTASDEEIIGKLLRGEMSLAQLDPSKDNVEGIRAVYEAKRAYEDAVKPVAEYKRLVHAQLRSKADGFLDTANSWKDKKSGLAYSRETMTRNIYDIVPDKALAKRILQAYFEPVQMAEAARTRFKTEMRDRVRTMKLSQKIDKGNIVSEAAAVQILGEAQDNMESLKRTQAYIKTRDGKTLDEWGAVIENLWLNNPNLDKGKIQRGVEEFRKIYDELFTKMNEVRVRFGYEPVSYRKGYFPHFQPDGGDGIMAFFGKAFGINTQVDVLPTTINGLTHTFRPGTTWFGNAQERLGFNTVYDAVEGFDRYIEGVSDVIYHTENIQNLRALASQIRYRTSEEGLRKQVDEIRKKDGLSDAEKEELIKATLEKGKYTLSNFVNELEEYTNLLANKKSKLDRTFEALVGRGRFYRFMRSMNSRVAANMVGGNVSSAITNFIPITQAAGRVGDINMLKAMWNTAFRGNDGIVGMSDFLTSRRGSDTLVEFKGQQGTSLINKAGYMYRVSRQKASDFSSKLMDIVDNFTSGTIVRAAYYKNLESGMSEAEALHEADVFAAGVMAGRAKGDMPTLFHSVNPLIKAFTQFQLEVNNQYSEVFKDMPRQHRGQAAYKFAMAVLSYFVRAYLFNELFELLFGRRAALDPINLLNEFVGDATGYEIPSLSSIVAGEASFKTDKKGTAVALDNLGKSALGELPFASGLTLFGIETDGGRIPVSSAIPDLSVFKDILSNDNWAPEYKKKKAIDELSKLMYVIPPFGGGQALKTWKGLNAYMKGGSYGMDSKGNDLLQYPIYKDSPIEALGNALRVAVMGKSSVPEAVEWVEDGFDSFGSKQTAMYKDMLDAGVKARDAYELIDALRSAKETEGKSKKDVQLEMIRSSKISDEGKAIAVYGFIDSDPLEEVMDLLDDAGVDAGTILDVVYGYREAQLLEKGTKAAQRQVILDADLTDSEKLLLVGELIGTDMETASGNPSEYAKLLDAMDDGMSVDDYLKLVQAEGDIDDYLEYTEAGLSNDQALRVVDALEDLEPEAGEDSVSDMQKWREIADMPFGDDVKSMALEGMMSDSQYEKYSIALAADISTYQYINFLEEASSLTSDKDKNGKTISGSLKKKVVNLIHGMPLTPRQKDALYLSKGYAESGLKDTPWH